MNLTRQNESSTVDNVEYLEYLNDKAAATKLGGVVFVGILMVIGVIGNLHVLYIYAFRFKRSTHRVYILCLAVVDTVTCCIGMPFVIIDLQYPLMFSAEVVCQILRFLNYFMCSGSAIILIVIVVDRYKNICHPFEPQMTEQRAKIACGISLFIALCLSWPAPILYGRSSVSPAAISSYLHIEVKINVTGTQCFTQDKYFGTPYQTIFNVVLIGIIIILTTVLAILYGLICKAMFLHVKKLSKFSKNLQSGLSLDQNSQGTIYPTDGPRSPSENASSNDSSGTYTESLNNSQTSEQNNHKLNEIKLKRPVEETKLTNAEIVIVDPLANDKILPVTHEHKQAAPEDKGQSDSCMSKGASNFKEGANQQTENVQYKTNSCSDIADNENDCECKYMNNKVANIKNWDEIGLGENLESSFTPSKDDEINKSVVCEDKSYNPRNEVKKQQKLDDGIKFRFSDIHVGTINKEQDRENNFLYLQPENGECKRESNDTTGLSAIPKIEKKWETRVKYKTKENSKREKQTRRITLMLFIITVVFVLSFIPHLSLKTIAFLRKNFITNLSYTELVLYNTFVWSFFINNMANPIIYGFCDSNFRNEIKKTYKKCFRKLPLRKRIYNIK